MLAWTGFMESWHDGTDGAARWLYLVASGVLYRPAGVFRLFDAIARQSCVNLRVERFKQHMTISLALLATHRVDMGGQVNWRNSYVLESDHWDHVRCVSSCLEVRSYCFATVHTPFPSRYSTSFLLLTSILRLQHPDDLQGTATVLAS